MTRSNKQTQRIINQLQKNGWAPVPCAHQPAEVKRAIKLVGFRPAAKQCFANCQRLILNQDEVSFTYVEGIVKSIIPIQHAWLMLGNQVIDVTLGSLPEVLCSASYTYEEVRKSIIKSGFYGPVNQERLNVLQNCTLFGIPTAGRNTEELILACNERFGVLTGIIMQQLTS